MSLVNDSFFFPSPESLASSPSASSSSSGAFLNESLKRSLTVAAAKVFLTTEFSLSSSTSESFSSSHHFNSSFYDPSLEESASNVRLPLYLRCAATTICIILLIIGISGNALVPYVVLRNKDLRNSTNIFLINLSISDILVLIISTPTVLIELHSQPEVWFLGSFVCKSVSFVEICVAHASILTILAISFERFYAICRPLEAGYKCTKRRAIIIIVINWIIAVTSTLPMLSITQLSTAEFIDGSLVTVCSNSLQEGWHPVYFFIAFIIFFLIPFCILLFLYILIARKLTSDSKSLSSNSNFKRQSQIRRQVVLMLASVCVTFFVCLLPFRLMTLWIIMSSSEDIHSLGMETYYSILFICRILLYVNSSANPILYNLISSKFRAAFCRVLKVNHRFLRRRGGPGGNYGHDHSVLSDKTSTTLTKTSLVRLSSSQKNNHATTAITTPHHNHSHQLQQQQSTDSQIIMMQQQHPRDVLFHENNGESSSSRAIITCSFSHEKEDQECNCNILDDDDHHLEDEEDEEGKIAVHAF